MLRFELFDGRFVEESWDKEGKAGNRVGRDEVKDWADVFEDHGQEDDYSVEGYC